jgi:thiamine biosynthesis protein ThiS
MIDTMQLTVNGKARQVEGPLTLLGLVEQLGIDPRIIAVEHNGDIVKRDRYAETGLADGDKLEIVRMVGGG